MRLNSAAFDDISNNAVLFALLVAMTENDPDRFRKEAKACREHAAEARNPADKEAWQRLASDWIKLADGLERVRRPPSTN
jgi:outer membrane murein-binding lipoprotein Lpp